jgi:hypothetical protein
MCGISNSIILSSVPGFNNLKLYYALDSEFTEFFSLSKHEVNETVNFLFNETQPVVKNKIMSNIDDWYNGYYADNSSPIYSMFSTGLYLNDCFREYIDLQIQPNETSIEWIPKPD